MVGDVFVNKVKRRINLQRLKLLRYRPDVLAKEQNAFCFKIGCCFSTRLTYTCVNLGQEKQSRSNRKLKIRIQLIIE